MKVDNNRTEQAISPFMIGRKSWDNVYSTKGTQASAVIYSIVGTAKVNSLNAYNYLEYLFTELPKYTDDNRRDFIKDLLPRAEAIQYKYHSPKKT